MKRILFISLSSLFLLACANRQNETRYLPAEVDDAVHFDMPLSEFKNLKGSKAAQQDDGMSFRKVFFEEVGGELVDYFGYYFDADDHQPLYEVIIGYKTEAAVTQEAVKLLGAPNYKEVEWKFEIANSPDIIAWQFKNKLIIAALIPKTEWSEEMENKSDK